MTKEVTKEEAIESLEAQRDCIILSCQGGCHGGKECDECDFMYAKGTMGTMRQALDMAITALKERKTMTHEEAVGFLQESGWLQDHDRQIYEQGKRDGIEERKTGKWIFGETMGHSWMKCSECCKSQDGQTLCFTYCPNCGAKMEGAEE